MNAESSQRPRTPASPQPRAGRALSETRDHQLHHPPHTTPALPVHGRFIQQENWFMTQQHKTPKTLERDGTEARKLKLPGMTASF